MNRPSRPFSLLLAVLLSGFAAGFTAAAQEPLPLRILHYNDFHSQNLPFKVSGKDDDGAKATIEVGGLACLRGAVDAARDARHAVQL
jgi:2',3'-cyclic-nucleotide 2'-phosphodiesterase (5'-nucleotidase family)